MNPIHLEETLFLRCNKKYWHCKTVNDVNNNKTELKLVFSLEILQLLLKLAKIYCKISIDLTKANVYFKYCVIFLFQPTIAIIVRHIRFYIPANEFVCFETENFSEFFAGTDKLTCIASFYFSVGRRFDELVPFKTARGQCTLEQVGYGLVFFCSRSVKGRSQMRQFSLISSIFKTMLFFYDCQIDRLNCFKFTIFLSQLFNIKFGILRGICGKNVAF